MTLSPNSTPLHLTLLIHIYGVAGPIPNREFPAQRQYLEELAELGLIGMNLMDHDSPATITERGKVYLDMVLSTPLPIQKWADPREES
jgi:hypothetical protein